MIYGGFCFTAGLFIFGCKYAEISKWKQDTLNLTGKIKGTSYPHVDNYWPSLVGILLIGFGFTTIFQSSLQYLVDTFTRYSASAIAANAFLRSILAGAFPLFIYPMYENIGVAWGNTIFACVSALLLPFPFIFFFWGARIRAKGQWSKLSTF